MTVEFTLMRFNPRRASRGAPAAEVLISEVGVEDDLLWMDQRDLRRNIKEFGKHPELLKAQEHYRTRKEFPEPKNVAPKPATIRPCWITTTGEVIPCPNPNDHMHTAGERFPDAKNPEREAELGGWIKITGYCDLDSDPIVFAAVEPNQSQIDALYAVCGSRFDGALESIKNHMGYISVRARSEV